MNTAPIKTLLYALEPRKLGEQGSIKIYKEMHKIWAQNCKNIVQHCKWHNSLNTLPIETILYALQPHKQGKHNGADTQQEIRYLQLQLYTSFTTIQIKPVKIHKFFW